MNEQTRIHLTNLQNKLKEISRYSHCARLMSFDRETIAPKDACLLYTSPSPRDTR